MSLIVTLFVVTLVSQCWTTPQRRNWTPQAILYLKGAQGHRSVLERASRDKDDTLHLATHKQSSDGLGLSWASSLLLELVQLAMEEGGRKLDNYPNEEELNLNYF
ncbi:putative spexin-like [Scophthalmus maximus]|uniref:Putative spexin-like n=1 Tax=Scophthalmus maximus TaxID=52904 RepID=A0A2U9BYB7_SCOMX|nr:spexin prohormone 1-like [Scophthalmus maximus]AWP08182.1 putative spexin-like [Scophthalmus maximus]